MAKCGLSSGCNWRLSLRLTRTTLIDANETGWPADFPQGELGEHGKRGKIRGYP